MVKQFFLLDRDVKGGYGMQGQPVTNAKILLEYGYFQVKNFPLYWIVGVGAASEQLQFLDNNSRK